MKKLLCALGATMTLTTAMAWPDKTVTIVVPFPPGGSTDLIARTLQPRLQEKLGGTFVVENKAGATGTIGAASIAAIATSSCQPACVMALSTASGLQPARACSTIHCCSSGVATWLMVGSKIDGAAGRSAPAQPPCDRQPVVAGEHGGGGGVVEREDAGGQRGWRVVQQPDRSQGMGAAGLDRPGQAFDLVFREVVILVL